MTSDRSRERGVLILATGDELVQGVHADLNSTTIARRLVEIGFEPRRFVVLGDDEDGLARAVVTLAPDVRAIVITGGLGPTLDDVTRHAVARAAGVDLVRDEAVLVALAQLFQSRGRPFAASNERQALFPRGSTVLENRHGTAAGFALDVGGCRVFALPGPPREMVPMLEEFVVPELTRLAPVGSALARRGFYLFGLPESAFADAAGSWMDRDGNPLIGVTSKSGVLSVTLLARDEAGQAASARAEAACQAFRERFGAWIFSEHEAEPALALGRELLARGAKIALAESCTGGLATEKLTRVPGISAVLEMSFVTYSNRAKIEVLGVDPSLLARHGAVSAQVAAAMARGAAERSGAHLAVSITGIAGPSGGTTDKPVGLVWFGLAHGGDVSTEERRFVVRDRESIREFAANTALDLARRALTRVRA